MLDLLETAKGLSFCADKKKIVRYVRKTSRVAYALLRVQHRSVQSCSTGVDLYGKLKEYVVEVKLLSQHYDEANEVNLYKILDIWNASNLLLCID